MKKKLLKPTVTTIWRAEFILAFKDLPSTISSDEDKINNLLDTDH